MDLRTPTLSVAFATLAALPLAAQSASLRPAASSLFRSSEAAAPTDTLHLPRTYWKEGALIVGIPSAIFGAALGSGMCGMEESIGKNCTLSGLAFGAVLGGVGAITGALIGGQIEKH
jgi:hypothetical protein